MTEVRRTRVNDRNEQIVFVASSELPELVTPHASRTIARHHAGMPSYPLQIARHVQLPVVVVAKALQALIAEARAGVVRACTHLRRMVERGDRYRYLLAEATHSPAVNAVVVERTDAPAVRYHLRRMAQGRNGRPKPN
jgi:hypothetical protein